MSGDHKINNGEVLIAVSDLKKAFGNHVVLDGITTEIRKGEVVVIIGPSGSGKSTFLRSLNLLERPTGGHIYFEGVEHTGIGLAIANRIIRAAGFDVVNADKEDEIEKHIAGMHG